MFPSFSHILILLLRIFLRLAWHLCLPLSGLILCLKCELIISRLSWQMRLRAIQILSDQSSMLRQACRRGPFLFTCCWPAGVTVLHGCSYARRFSWCVSEKGARSCLCSLEVACFVSVLVIAAAKVDRAPRWRSHWLTDYKWLSTDTVK